MEGGGDRLQRAREQYAAGAVADAVRTCSAILDGCTVDTDPSLVAAAATLVRRPVDPLLRARVHVLACEALALLRRAGSDAHRAAALVAAQAESTRDVFHEADPVEAGEGADAEAEFIEIQARVTALQDPLRADDRRTLARRAVSLGLASGDREIQAWGRLWVMDVHASRGRRVELLGQLAVLTVLAERLGPAWQSRVVLVRASQALLDGRFEDAVRLAEEAAAIGGEDSDAAFLRLPFAFEAARHEGTASAMLGAVREEVEHLPFVARTWLCVALKCAGHATEAADAWRALAPHVALVPREAPEFLMAVTDAADVCVWLGDESSAATLFDTLLPYRGQHIISNAYAPYQGPVDLVLGRLARLIGDLDAAGDHLGAALADTEGLHALPWKAYALSEVAALEPVRSRTRREHSDSALELARRLGMAPLVGQLEELVEPPARDSVLTPREIEVAGRVAQGLSNAAIARQLTLSERTVENHISRILLKLDLTSRTALALWFERRGQP